MSSALARLATAVLRPLGGKTASETMEVSGEPASPGPAAPARAAAGGDDTKPWDRQFAGWIAEAEATGQDPNDVGDADWCDDPKNEALALYRPHIGPRSVVLELGPGTGRYTRHLLPLCREMILVDYSRFVCDWIAKYLGGKGRFRVHRIDGPRFDAVPSASVNVVVAHGVFEHLDADETYLFLHEFRRVLAPGGGVAFSFGNFMSEGGLAWFRDWLPSGGGRSPFRFYHPEMLAALARAAGFAVLRVTTSRDRIGYIELRKPPGAEEAA